jgi:hypothetical protein
MNEKILVDMVTTPAPQCELGYPGICEGQAAEHGEHPTGQALGEDGWTHVWYCWPCAEQAALDS